MTANAMCVSCLLSKQEKIISDYLDANRKANYIEQVQEILNSYGSSESAPALVERILFFLGRRGRLHRDKT